LAYKILEALELHFYRSAAAIVILSEGFRENLTRRGIPSEKIFAVPNGADLAEFVPQSPDLTLKDQLGLQNKFVIGFIGTLGAAHGLDFILDCAPRLAGEGVQFLFIGTGAKKAELVARADREKLTNVTFVETIPRQEVPRYMALVDAALVNLKASDTFLEVIPSKIFEAGALQRPILLGVDGESRALVEKFGAGLFFTPENAEEFVAAIRRLRSEPALYTQLQAGCRNLAHAYDRNTLAVRALEVIHATATGR
jgi:glycosyltransferase involved in cell wall biosynthesis